jgi:hypothetical protein
MEDGPVGLRQVTTMEVGIRITDERIHAAVVGACHT